MQELGRLLGGPLGAEAPTAPKQIRHWGGLSMLTWAVHGVYGLMGLQIRSVGALLLCRRCCALWREHVVSLEEVGLLLNGLSVNRQLGQVWDLSKEVMSSSESRSCGTYGFVSHASVTCTRHSSNCSIQMRIR